MVRKSFCDRCDKEIDSELDGFDEVFDMVLDKKPETLKVHLCKKCEKGYDKIIKEANKKILDYINE